MTNIPDHSIKLLPVLTKIKEAYRLWVESLRTIPKTHRYTLGQKIDNLFIDLIEYTFQASQTEKIDRTPYLKVALRKINTLNLLILLAWEIKVISDNKYLALSAPLTEAGKMLGGWLGQTIKQNSPNK